MVADYPIVNPVNLTQPRNFAGLFEYYQATIGSGKRTVDNKVERTINCHSETYLDLAEVYSSCFQGEVILWF